MGLIFYRTGRIHEVIKVTEFLSEDARFIREEVFIKEQGFNNEFDEIDQIALHLVIYDEKGPIACCRYFEGQEQGEYIIGRIAVLKEYRGMQLGQKLIQEVEKQVNNLNGKKLSLSAQMRVMQFYEKQGFVALGEPYLDEECEHIHMEKYFK